MVEFAALRAAPHRLPDKVLFGTLAESRRLAAALINADAEEIALAPNTSFGVNLAARALPLEPGDVVLVSDREFPANVYPWLALRERGIEVELAPTTAEGWPDEAYMLQRVADPQVRVLAVSLTQFASGYTVDLGGLSRVTRMTNTLLVVDAIQGLGQIPVDVRATPVDVLATRRPEVAAVALGFGLRVRAARAIRGAAAGGYRLARLRGHGRPLPSHDLRHDAPSGRPPLRADDAPRTRTSPG